MTECSTCGAQMQEGQDWCLQCGAVRPKSLGAGGPGWRTGAAILAATAALVCGASVAAYAALNKTNPKPKHVTVAVVKPTTAPPPTTPGTIPPPSTTTPGIPTTVTPTTPSVPSTPTPSTPAEPVFPPETNTETTTKSTTDATKSSEKSGSKESGGESEPPSPILLDTNAASTYNPYSYPPTLFGDPSLAIDGEAKTAWTAQVQAEKAPNMAEGLLLDLKSPQKLGSATVKTATTGATVEIYGANGKTVPGSITDTGWKRLVGLKVLKKKSTPLTLKTESKGYRYVVLWLAKAPAGSAAAAPGAVAINEFELFPPK